MSAFCTYIRCVRAVAVNIKNVHFKHVCLFISDLLLMSDCFHVSCALHFDIVSPGHCHACITQKKRAEKRVQCTAIFIFTAYQIRSTAAGKSSPSPHISFFLRADACFFSVLFFFGAGNKNCNIKTNKD